MEGEGKAEESAVVTDSGAGKTVDNKGTYEELPVDEGQQNEINDLMGFAPAKKEEKASPEDDELLNHFTDGGEKGEGKEKEAIAKDSGKEGPKEVKKEIVVEESADGDEKEDPTIVAMREQILKLSEELSAVKSEQTKSAPVKKEGEAKGEKKEEATPAQKPAPITFESLGIEIDDETYDKMFEDKKVLHKVLGDVAAKTAEATATRIYTALPKVIDSMVRMQVGINLKANEMYTANADLKPHAKFVGQVANQLSAEHPDWDINKIFEEVPKKTRELLGLKAKAARKEEAAITTRQRPGFANRGSGVRTSVEGPSKLTPEQQEIEDLLKSN